MSECTDCERYKKSAALWRNKAYELAGTSLPWKPNELYEIELHSIKQLDEYMGLIDKIAKLDPKILLADGYDDCLIGLAFREGELVALYSAERIIEKLSEDMTMEEAYEYFEFNIEGAYVGPKTPMFY